MDIQLSDRVRRIKPSPTLAVTARAAELRAAGHDIIGLGAGEPDFDTPAPIKAAAIAAIEAGQTKYTPVDGTPGLKQAIINKFEGENGLRYAPEQILVSCGGKQSFYNLAQALLNSGDEVIIPAPYWVSYPDMVRLADGVPVELSAGIDQQFKLTPAQLEAAITPRTRLFVINSPSNPTGVAYSRTELAALGEVLSRHPRVLIATDDMYEHILWADEPFCNIVNACPELQERTFVLNGVSKAYAMTGWRIGYAGGPAEVIQAMKKIQSQSTSNPASVSQAAAQAA
ncbi:MAG TPA: pyridoxal phosphate-dependent aminotransferase, partial [Gammaproteobacteria bacterium]|nr:pyridoxal phosphate-dependent aminotransferase [Gammaproteobacteria bacterium]